MLRNEDGGEGWKNPGILNTAHSGIREVKLHYAFDFKFQDTSWTTEDALQKK